MPYMKNGHRDYETRVRTVPQPSGTEAQPIPTNSATEAGQ